MTQSRLVFAFEKPGAQQNLEPALDEISQVNSVTVSVPARLHLGFLDLNGDLGRRFGGIGLAIGGLGTRLTIKRASSSEIAGPDADRVSQHLQQFERLLSLGGKHHIRVSEVAPAHAGLGSGTQLALAVAAGLRTLHKLPLDIAGDALRLGRGARSGIGIGLFSRGGLVVDGGRGTRATPAPIICHLPVPENWRILVILDRQRQGIHGPEEATTMAALPAMCAGDAAHLCRLVMMQALPALADHDLENFGAAIRQLQIRLGDYFAPAQGGARFTSPDVGAFLHALDNAGAFGVGQSSWGPTGFAFAKSPEDATRLAGTAARQARSNGLDIRICQALNRGAQIVGHAHSTESRY